MRGFSSFKRELNWNQFYLKKCFCFVIDAWGYYDTNTANKTLSNWCQEWFAEEKKGIINEGILSLEMEILHGPQKFGITMLVGTCFVVYWQK